MVHTYRGTDMIDLDDGLVLSGRCTCGNQAGYICWIGRDTYRIRWLDGEFTEQLRPEISADEFADAEVAAE